MQKKHVALTELLARSRSKIYSHVDFYRTDLHEQSAREARRSLQFGSVQFVELLRDSSRSLHL